MQAADPLMIHRGPRNITTEPSSSSQEESRTREAEEDASTANEGEKRKEEEEETATQLSSIAYDKMKDTGSGKSGA
jgi:hypothetical protein